MTIRASKEHSKDSRIFFFEILFICVSLFSLRERGKSLSPLEDAH
jgi:hypothetical protein